MRLHALTVTAFGPFAGTERVDFDELNEAGLFLLTGATGAGKSSLLDAVCFALYGTVPGVRGVKALKSQHAPAAARPEVVLDLTVQGRRFRLRRTPEWTRPKQRGTGLLTEKASASLVETTSGTDRLVSARAAEVGLAVGDLMGMNADQFVQVALLPQGEFQTFLRASSQERHDVLQQLFRTDRFARIEDWVGDHSRRLRDQAGVGRSTVQRLLDTVADRALLETSQELCGEELAAAAAAGRVQPWVDGVLAAVEDEARLGRARLRGCEERLRAARDLHRSAVTRLERLARHGAARSTLAALEETESLAADARAALDAHEQALRCRPVLELHAEAERAHQAATAGRDRAMSALAGSPFVTSPAGEVPDSVSVARVASLVEAARSRLARLEAVVPREEAGLDALRARERDLAALQAAEGDLADAVRRAAQLPPEIERLSAELTSAAAVATRQELLSASLVDARARLRAARDLVGSGELLARLHDARRDARDRMQDARDELQSLVARRLAGMAAELAGALVDGAACQVCGSTDHPARATAATDAVDDRDHRTADLHLNQATSALDLVQEELGRAQREHDVLAAAGAGLSPERAAELIATLEAELDEAREAGGRADQLVARLATLRPEHAGLGRRETAAAAAAARLRESVAAHDRTLQEVTADVAAALGASPGAASVGDAIARESAGCDLLVRVEQALVELDATQTRLAATSRQASAAADEHGFATLTEVEQAVLTPSVRDRLETLLRERADAAAGARAVLDDPGPAEPPGSSDPGEVVAHLTAELQDAESAHLHGSQQLALHEDRVSSLHHLRDRLRSALDAWAPIRDESLRAEAISKLVRGMGRDNQLQMRLSAYVLATRLDQVVAAANERLGHMRDQRYLLQRTGRAERRSAQAGLGLEVVDQWTGDVRSPSTLSGGETFVVSLSLALGLADVVTQESGGTEVETLFVDEGFGTLDADTLDDVMDRLDGLRAGGRTVGIVSHVSELRSRIPTQVQVTKGRAGSTVQVLTLVG